MIESKKDLLDELNAARHMLLSAIEGLTAEQMCMPGAVGYWSVKDVLAHLVAWETELVTALYQLDSKRAPSVVEIEDIYGWNEEIYHMNARRPLEAILEDLEGVHKALVKNVEALNTRQLMDNRSFKWMEGEPLWYLIEETATLHEREHAEEILAWREENGF
nr:ClbS/DfsB family four-helix bundle protein [Anaerolineae bacterium]